MRTGVLSYITIAYINPLLDLDDVINCVKFHYDQFRGFWTTDGPSLAFPIGTQYELVITLHYIILHNFLGTG